MKPGPFDLDVPGTPRAHTSTPRLPWVCIVVLVHWILILPFSDVQHLGNTGHDEGPGWETQPGSGFLRLWTYICHFIPWGGPTVASDPREGVFPVLPLTHDTVGCFAEPSPSEVLGDIFSGTYSFLIPGIFELMGKLGRGFALLLICLKRKTSSSTQNISLISAAFTRQLVSLSCNTGRLLRRFPYLSFCSEIAKASGRLWNRFPEFLPPFSEERIKSNVILKAGMGKWHQPLHASYFPFLLGHRSTFWCRFQATLLSSDGARNHCDPPGTPPCRFQVRSVTQLFLSNNYLFEFSW